MLAYFNVELIRSINASSNFLKRFTSLYVRNTRENSTCRYREGSITRSVVCLIGLFILCQVPASILHYIHMFYRNHPVLYICYDISNFLILLNSAVRNEKVVCNSQGMTSCLFLLGEFFYFYIFQSKISSRISTCMFSFQKSSKSSCSNSKSTIISTKSMLYSYSTTKSSIIRCNFHSITHSEHHFSSRIHLEIHMIVPIEQLDLSLKQKRQTVMKVSIDHDDHQIFPTTQLINDQIP